MTCPDCGYMMTAFEKDCPRCERIGKPQRSCLKCGTSSGMREVACQRCGHRFGDPLEPLARAETPPEHAVFQGSISALDRDEMRRIAEEVVAVKAAPVTIPPSFMPLPNFGLIVTMWLLTGIAWSAFLLGVASFGLLMDAIAVVVAIVLANSRSRGDKANGWVKITLEAIAFVVALVNAGSSHSG